MGKSALSRAQADASSLQRVLGFRTKFFLASSAIAVIAVAVMTGVIRNSIRDHWEGRLIGEELFWCRNAAKAVGGSIAPIDRRALIRELNQLLNNSNDIAYLIVEDFKGEAIAHTFDPKTRVPVHLRRANPVPSGKDFATAKIEADGASFMDIAVPLSPGGGFLLRGGVDLKPLSHAITRMTLHIAGVASLTFLAGILAMAAYVALLLRPLGEIIGSVRKTGTGVLDQDVPVRTDDEIGRLARAYNEMLAGLRESKAAVEAANSRIAGILASMGEALLVVSRQGIIEIGNPALHSLLGYGTDELIGKPIETILSKDELPCIALSNRRVVLATKDGGETNVLLSVADLHLDGEQQGLICVAKDLTEIENSQKALSFHEQRYRKLTEHVDDELLMADKAGRILEANRTACEKLGYSKAELLRMTIPDIETQWNEDEIKGFRDRLQETGSCTVLGRHRRKDGTTYPVEVRVSAYEIEGRPVTLASARDISAREEADSRLRRAQAVQAAVNSLLSLALDPISLEEFLDEALERILRIPGLDVLGKGAIFLSEEDGMLRMTAQRGMAVELLKACARLPLGKCLCGRAAQTGKPQLICAVGGEHEISFEGMAPHGHACLPIKSQGRVLGVLNLYLDEGHPPDEDEVELLTGIANTLAGVIERRAAEKSLRANEAQLRQSQKMEAIGRLAGGIAHDFNNILTIIVCNTKFMLQSAEGRGAMREELEEINEAGTRAAALTSQLLTFSRRQKAQPQTLDLNFLLRNMERMIRRIIGENVTVGLELRPGSGCIEADRGQIEQLVMNFAVNARDAMKSGGRILFRTGESVLNVADCIKRPGLAPGRYVTLSVTDEGCGMDKATQERIFEPFFTTKEQGKGTGLGLSIVYGIVKQAGGHIEVDSEIGAGTTFRVFLPAVQARAAGVEEAAAAAGALKHETILLVEDEPGVRKIARRVLDQSGYRVIEASNAREALDAFEANGESIDLLLTDVVMPGMSGPELRDRLVRSKPGLRVLFMSGYSDDETVSRAGLKPGMNLMLKPFEPATLAKEVRGIFDGKVSAGPESDC